ncbi:MAG: proteophosphoglycan 5 [Bacteroidota bacterium]
MSLVSLDLPSPASLRPGWAALAAVYAARGWTDVCATDREWMYHDGGGNWACLRFHGADRAVLFGHDHEYSETYWGPAAEYFGEEETDLLAGAPDWWSTDLTPPSFGTWIGFVYGWDGERWHRAPYAKHDGFRSVGLIEACLNAAEHLVPFAKDAPGLEDEPDTDALRALVAADADLSAEIVDAAVPGWDTAAGVSAGRAFLARP